MDIETIGVAAAVFVGWGTLVLLLSIVHRDVAALRERMARLEGLFEGLTTRDSLTRDCRAGGTLFGSEAAIDVGYSNFQRKFE